jgi:hypothetical protein
VHGKKSPARTHEKSLSILTRKENKAEDKNELQNEEKERKMRYRYKVGFYFSRHIKVGKRTD